MLRNASIQEAARLASAFGIAFSPNAKIAGQLTAKVHAQGPTDRLALNGNSTAAALKLRATIFREPVKVPALDLAMTPQDIRTAISPRPPARPRLAGQMTLSQYTTASPNVDATLKTVNGKVEELLSIAKAYGVSAVEGMSGSGAVSLDIHATGPIKNTNAMNFNGTGAMQNATLKTPTLTQPLNVKNANLQFTQNSVNVTNLAASLASTNANGNVSVANFQAPNLRFALECRQDQRRGIAEAGGQRPRPVNKKADASWSLVPTAKQLLPQPRSPAFCRKRPAAARSRSAAWYMTAPSSRTCTPDVKLDHGVIQLNPLTAQVYGGQINGSHHDGPARRDRDLRRQRQADGRRCQPAC